MPSPEDLYGEIQRQDEADAQRYGVAPKAPPPRKLVNEAVARDRFMKDVAPVLARIKRAEAGLPITNNPLKNLYLKITGQDKVKPVEAVDPTPGIAVNEGTTAEQARQAIIANPEKFKDLKHDSPHRR